MTNRQRLMKVDGVVGKIKEKARGGGGIFAPDRKDLVRMIAMQGATDDEIAHILGCSADAFAKWKKLYPSFAKALSEGRMAADVEVVASLHQQAVGYHYEEDAVTAKGGIVTVKKYARGDTDAAKYWLNNRQPEHWSSRTQVMGGNKPSDQPLGVKVESREEIIAAIVSLIPSKADGAAKP